MVRFASLLAIVALVVPNSVNALWPAPKSLSTGSTALRLAGGFNIKLNIANAPSDLNDAVQRTKQLLQNDKLQMLTVGRGANNTAAVKSSKQLNSLTLSLNKNAKVQSISTEAVADLTQRKEEYSLHIPSDGSAATLTADSTLGLLRGLTTFGQLWYELNGDTYTMLAPISITDAPAFPYRGFMLDTARNFFPVSSILPMLDALSWVKINTFHWHIVDSQSFPLEVAGFPELSQAAAYTSTSVYTSSDVQNIVKYAAARGIDVMLEIDTPGHTAAIANSHPDLVACNQASPWTSFANEPPAGQLRFADPKVISFTQSLFKSVASQLPSKLFSTGGDEINANCYTQDPLTQQLLNSSGQSFEQALSKFTQATHSTLIEMGKTPVVWEEMVLSHNVTLANNTIAMVWISSDDVAAVAAKGFRIIHAASDFFYLDCGGGGWVGNNVAGNSWCDPFKTWQKAYSFDPLAGVTASQKSLILGGEQLLWTEQSGPQNMEPIVWPRAAASAEVFWTGATLPSGQAANVQEALPRLHDLRFRLVQRGINAIALQPEWCAIRPDACDLV
ncbi:glycoside hydrolase family 20 protein [Sphaerobolus stellatus SS14]|nr:glycoside hydrolase family 20 protein [Sphaerobolus stellatus SS14]